MSNIQGGRLDLGVDGLVDVVDTLADIVRGALPALADQGGDFLGLRLEWVGVAGLDRVHGLVRIAVGAHKERGEGHLERFGEFVGG